MTDDATWTVPAEEFDRLAAELERPAQIVEPMVELARRVPSPAQRSDWFSSNFETWTPTDAAERADFLAQLADEAIHGPAAGQETP